MGRKGPKPWLIVVALAVAAAGTPPPPAAAEPAPGQRDSRPQGTVTLVTGDTVTLSTVAGRRSVDVRPGPGRGGVKFAQRVVGDRVEVTPSDTLAGIATGTLDRRLFDVTGLLAGGYGRAGLPLIIGYQPAARRARGSAPAGTERPTELASIAAVAVRQRRDDPTAFWKSVAAPGGRSVSTGVRRIWLDGRVKATLSESVPQVGADRAWAAGATGRGVKVAVLDTGYDQAHPDLKGLVAGARDFTETDPEAQDDHGHGTHVAATVAGSGAAAGGRYKGVAPDARLLVGKVLDAGGSGNESQIIAGMEWATSQGARVVSMSLGGNANDGTDPMSQALNRLTADTGAIFVVAAGNEGRAASVGSPASADAALTVGSVTKQDALSRFSSQGPRYWDHALKPDLTAPGSDIVAARAAGSGMGEPVDERYTKASGTSMATPHVAGAAAILAQLHPDWKAPQLKAALMGSAAPRDGLTPYQQGTGRLDVARAVAQRVHAVQPVADFAAVRWPHQVTAGREVAYRNDTDTPVTLRLASDLRGPDGKPAPAGLFTLAVTSLTVPARSTASTTVTLRATTATPSGLHGGRLTATGPGGLRISSVVAAFLEPESYHLTVSALARDGSPVTFLPDVLNVADSAQPQCVNRAQRWVCRVPKGSYAVHTLLSDEKANETVLLSDAETVVAGDREMVLDGRRARRLTVATPQSPGTSTGFRAYGLVETFRDTRFVITALLFPNGAETSAYAWQRAPVTNRPLRFFYRDTRSVPLDPARPEQRPDAYSLHFGNPGGVPERLDYAVRKDQLARVEARYHGRGTAAVGTRNHLAGTREADLLFGGWYEVPFSGGRTEYFTPGTDTVWFAELALGDWREVSRQPRSYQLGRGYQERYNTAAIGPRVVAGHRKDGLSVNVGAFNSADPGAFHSAEPGLLRGALSDVPDQLVLYRDGREIGRSDGLAEVYLPTPPGRAGYRLTASATRQPDQHSTLATRVDSAWTFTSAPGSDRDPNRPPLLNLRITGGFDPLNQAPAGKPFTLTMAVETMDSAPLPATVATLQVSYDAGATWQPLELAAKGTEWTATVRHPDRPGFVALRATAQDRAGNRVEQTVHRAYGLK